MGTLRHKKVDTFQVTELVSGSPGSWSTDAGLLAWGHQAPGLGRGTREPSHGGLPLPTGSKGWRSTYGIYAGKRRVSRSPWSQSYHMVSGVMVSWDSSPALFQPLGLGIWRYSKSRVLSPRQELYGGVLIPGNQWYGAWIFIPEASTRMYKFLEVKLSWECSGNHGSPLFFRRWQRGQDKSQDCHRCLRSWR